MDFSLLVFQFRQTGVKVKCLVAIKQFRIWIFHFSFLVFHFRQTGVKAKCLVAIKQSRIWIFHFSLLVFHFNVPTDLHELLSVAKIFRNKTNVPANLQSAGIKYKDL